MSASTSVFYPYASMEEFAEFLPIVGVAKVVIDAVGESISCSICNASFLDNVGYGSKCYRCGSKHVCQACRDVWKCQCKTPSVSCNDWCCEKCFDSSFAPARCQPHQMKQWHCARCSGSCINCSAVFCEGVAELNMRMCQFCLGLLCESCSVKCPDCNHVQCDTSISLLHPSHKMTCHLCHLVKCIGEFGPGCRVCYKNICKSCTERRRCSACDTAVLCFDSWCERFHANHVHNVAWAPPAAAVTTKKRKTASPPTGAGMSKRTRSQKAS